MGYAIGYGYGFDRKGWVKAPFWCDGIWLLTPTGIPLSTCTYVWDDTQFWEDSFFWTENL